MEKIPVRWTLTIVDAGGQKVTVFARLTNPPATANELAEAMAAYGWRVLKAAPMEGTTE
jgi:hypothetical protein